MSIVFRTPRTVCFIRFWQTRQDSAGEYIAYARVEGQEVSGTAQNMQYLAPGTVSCPQLGQ